MCYVLIIIICDISPRCAGETEHSKEEMESALAAENTRLRGELDRIRQRQPAPVIIQKSAQVLY